MLTDDYRACLSIATQLVMVNTGRAMNYVIGSVFDGTYFYFRMCRDGMKTDAKQPNQRLTYNFSYQVHTYVRDCVLF